MVAVFTLHSNSILIWNNVHLETLSAFLDASSAILFKEKTYYLSDENLRHDSKIIFLYLDTVCEMCLKIYIYIYNF